jgi:hypothetical protein
MKQFARKCTKCNKGMNDGYLVNDVEYYCSDECLYSVYSEDEYEDLYIEGSAYYTEWSEDDIDHDDEPIYESNIPSTIKIDVCYTSDENGAIIFDEEQMRQMFETKLNNLKN